MHTHSKRVQVPFVSFSGIDGAGKSTQIETLLAAATQAGMRVRIVRFWDDVARLKNIREASGHKIFKGDKGVGSPSRPINRRDKNVQSIPMTCLRLLLYLVDAASLRRVLTKAKNSDCDMIIFDRYIYDELANLKLRNFFLRAYARLILKMVPKPTIGYLLDADPAKARARKPEYPLDFLHINRQAYLDISRMTGQLTVIAPMPIAEVKREVLRHAFEELPFERDHRYRAIIDSNPDGAAISDEYSRPAAS